LCDLCDEETQGVLKNFLHDGTLPSFSLNPIKNPISGSITAPLVGGNLCMLTTTMGTPFQLDCSNSILMLEDIGEPAYKIHRMFTQLTLSGMLDTVQAIVLGTFTNCTTPKPSQLLLDFILDALQDTPTPIYSGALFGHGAQNHIWNAGRQYTLNEGILYVG
jgi:muramoyltetrapeptide carboxypeptidase